MAATSVILDIRANTTRALSEFKRFSAQLDNKFLISGLKLDVVRSALGQINREFQRAIGEQGLASGQSLRAAQNQAALILDTFKNVGIESSVSITEQFSNAFSEIAITAGGTAQDIKKALGASAWISTNLAEDVRKQLAEGVLTFQRDARRAGLGDNYAEIIQQFLSGQVTARDLINSEKPLESAIGAALGRTSAAGGTIDNIASAEQRSRIVAELQNSSQLRSTLQQLIARADWGFTIIEDLNARLFNPERGVFGVLRQVTMAVGDKTSILQETRALIDSIFGKQGLFVTFFEQVGKIFGIEDPLKVVIRGVRWITRQFNELNEFLQSPEMQAIVGILKNAFNGVKDFVTNIYNSIQTNLDDPNSNVNQIGKNIGDFFKSLKKSIDENLKDPTSILSNIKNIGDSIGKFFVAIGETIKSGDWNPDKINESIRNIGESIRSFIESIGKTIRKSDVNTQGNFILSIIQTLIEEIAKTLGVVINQTIKTVFSDKGLSVLLSAIGTLEKALSGLFTGLFGNELIGKIFGGAALAGIGIAFVRRIRSSLMSIIDPILSEGQRLRRGGGGVGGFINRLLGGGRTFDATNLEGGRMGFQAQVIARMDAIIRILGGYAGPSSPLELGDVDPRRSGPPGSRVGRGGRTSAQRLQAIRDIRRQRIISQGGVRGLGARVAGVGNRIGSGWSAMPGWGRGAILAGIGLTSILGIAGSGRAGEMPGELPPELQAQIDSLKQLQGEELRQMRASGASQQEMQELRKIQKQELEQQRREAQKEKVEQGRESTKGWLGLGAGLAGSLAGGKAGAALGTAIGGPWGTVIGGVVGSIAGGILGEEAIKLLSDQVLDSIGNLSKNISTFFTKDVPNWWESKISKPLNSWGTETMNKIKNGFSSLGETFSNIDWKQKLTEIFTPGGGVFGSPFAGSGNFEGLKNTMEALVSPVKNIWDRISGWRFPWQSGNAAGSYQGVNYFGPTLRQESLMSGADARIVNNREFVIPRDGFPILADAVSNRLSQTRSQSASRVSANFNITINVNGGLADNNIEQLRGPIMTIINDAWKEATNGVATRGAIV